MDENEKYTLKLKCPDESGQINFKLYPHYGWKNHLDGWKLKNKKMKMKVNMW